MIESKNVGEHSLAKIPTPYQNLEYALCEAKVLPLLEALRLTVYSSFQLPQPTPTLPSSALEPEPFAPEAFSANLYSKKNGFMPYNFWGRPRDLSPSSLLPSS